MPSVLLSTKPVSQLSGRAGSAQELGHSLTAFQIMPFLFYPYALLVSVLIFIFVISEKKKR